MLAIQLMRTGAKKRPSYRVVVKEKKSKRDGAYLENVGTYNPARQPAERVGLAPKRGPRWAPRLGRANGGDGRTFWQQAYSVAATLGWISSETRYDGILAGTPESFARSLSLYTTGRSSLVDRTARALN